MTAPSTDSGEAGRRDWPEITDAWVDVYCELTGRDPEGGSVTFLGDGPVSTSFRDAARREIDAMLCAASKADVRKIAAHQVGEKVSAPSQGGVRTLDWTAAGRCVAYEGDPIYEAFKPSKEAIAAIERHEIANSQALAALSDMMARHVTNWPSPKRFGTAVSLIDKTLHAALAPNTTGKAPEAAREGGHASD